MHLETGTVTLNNILVPVKKLLQWKNCFLQKSEEKLWKMRSTRKADWGHNAQWPKLEAHLCAWVLEQCAEDKGWFTVQLCLKVCTRAQEKEVVGFASGQSWCARFMRCNYCLTIRMHKSMYQTHAEFAQGCQVFSTWQPWASSGNKKVAKAFFLPPLT